MNKLNSLNTSSLNASDTIKTDVTKKEILTFEQFLDRQNEIEKRMEIIGQKGGQYYIFHKKFLRFKDLLKEYFKKDIDPIVYLYDLYYNQNLSVETITETLKNIYDELQETQYLFNRYNTLQKFLTHRLNWKLKDQKANKDTIVYKTRKATENILKPIQERKNQRVKEFYDWLIKYRNPNFKNFDENIMKNIKYKYEKFIYLLENVFFISKKDFASLKKLSIGNQFIAYRFNEILKENNIEYSFSDKDIERVFNRYI